MGNALKFLFPSCGSNGLLKLKKNLAAIVDMCSKIFNNFVSQVGILLNVIYNSKGNVIAYRAIYQVIHYSMYFKEAKNI